MTKKLFTLLALSLFTIFMLISCGGSTPNDSPAPAPEGTETRVSKDEWLAAFSVDDLNSLTFDWNASYEEHSDYENESETNYGTSKYANNALYNSNSRSNGEFRESHSFYEAPSSFSHIIEHSDVCEYSYALEDILWNYDNFTYDENSKYYYWSGVADDQNVTVKVCFSNQKIYSIYFTESCTMPEYNYTHSSTISMTFSNWNATTVEQ